MAEDIYKLWDRVTNHPDYAGGTIWVRQDVADACLCPDDDPDDFMDYDAPDEVVAQVTDEMLRQARKVAESYIFESGYSWREAFRDNITVPAGLKP